MTIHLWHFVFSTALIGDGYGFINDKEKAVDPTFQTDSFNLLPKYVDMAAMPASLGYDGFLGAPGNEPATPAGLANANDYQNDQDVECDDEDDNKGNNNNNNNTNSPPFPNDRCRHDRSAGHRNRQISLRMKLPEVPTTVSPPTTKFKWVDCKCQGYSCKCCAHLNFPAIRLNKDICITFTYDPEGATLKVAIDIGGWVIYKDSISALNPKPMCYKLPYTYNFGQLCAELVDVKITPTSISGCFNVYAKLMGAKVGESKVGCWELGPFPIPVPVPTTTSTTTTTPGTTTSPKPFDCNCQGYTCKCCVHLKWSKINLDKLACISFTYYPEGVTLGVKLDLSGWVVFEKRISALKPPPICITMPYANKFASLCTQMYDGKLEKDSFSGCFKVYAKLLGKTVGETKLGCFKIPLAGGKKRVASVLGT